MTHDLTDTHPHYVAVYGTLKEGHGNHPLLVRNNSKFVGPALTVEKFALNDGFPYVMALTGLPLVVRKLYEPYLGHVAVEVYKVTHKGLEECDRLEGHPNHYCRTPISVNIGSVAAPSFLTAGIYLITRPLSVDTLQKPDKGGVLEWGREDGGRAKAFQRSVGGRLR